MINEPKSKWNADCKKDCLCNELDCAEYIKCVDNICSEAEAEEETRVLKKENTSPHYFTDLHPPDEPENFRN